MPKIAEALRPFSVELRGCEETCKILPEAKNASDEDFYTEYNDYIMSIKVVNDIKEAIAHINEHGTRHSEAIVTTDYRAANRFLDEVDAAAVYVNASTRFTDGNEFGYGAEIGISTSFYRMLPYLITLIVLAFTSKNSRAPKAAGIPYDKSKR